MNEQRFTSVWDAIEDTPEQAANMKLRSVLMIALKDHITRAGMSQAQAAQLFGVTQPRVSDLMRGKISLFALDALVNMATAAHRNARAGSCLTARLSLAQPPNQAALSTRCTRIRSGVRVSTGPTSS